MTVKVQPFQYNAGCITFPEWVTLFTLCLAPLIAHIISGVVPVSYLAPTRPRWHDSVCHYNPTSIIWRYAAIVDRRIRATNWSAQDLAATNAIFWTKKGWNGEERMITVALPYCVQSPRHPHMDIFSSTMFKTVIVALQGISALYTLVGFLAGNATFNAKVGVNAVCFPLAIVGLLRLCAATCLTEDFIYAYSIEPRRRVSLHHESEKYEGLVLVQTEEDIDPWLDVPLEVESDIPLPNASWSSITFRAFYLSVNLGVWSFSLLYVIAQPGQWAEYSVTSFLTALFYFVFLTISNIVCVVYCVCGRTTTTIIPCISSLWYKMYTFLLIGLMFSLIVVAALETNRGQDGLYSSSSAGVRDECVWR